MKKCRANKHIIKNKDGYMVETKLDVARDENNKILCFKNLDEARALRNKLYEKI